MMTDVISKVSNHLNHLNNYEIVINGESSINIDSTHDRTAVQVLWRGKPSAQSSRMFLQLRCLLENLSILFRSSCVLQVFSKCALSVVNFRVIAHISSNCWQFSDPDFQSAEISQVRCGFTSGLQRCWLRNHPNPCKSDSSPWPKIKWHQQISPLGIGSDVGPHLLNWTWQTKTKGPFVHLLMLIHSDNLSLKESRTCWTCWTHAQNIET